MVGGVGGGGAGEPKRRSFAEVSSIILSNHQLKDELHREYHLCLFLFNNPAAEHLHVLSAVEGLSIVKHNGLTRGYGALWFVKNHKHSTAVEHGDFALHERLAITDAGRAKKSLRNFVGQSLGIAFHRSGLIADLFRKTTPTVLAKMKKPIA